MRLVHLVREEGKVPHVCADVRIVAAVVFLALFGVAAILVSV